MRPLKRLTQFLSDIAALAIAAMALLTVADIVTKNAFNRPIKGTFEIVELLLVLVVFFGVAEEHCSAGNICVTSRIRCSAQNEAALKMCAFASLVFLVLMGLAMTARRWTRDISAMDQETGIPLHAYWTPILAGTAIAIIAAAVSIWVRLSSSAAQDRA